EAGCELRENYVVDALLKDDRVTGIRGKRSEEHGDIVIGADGVHSMVARCVDAPEYDTRPVLSCMYYAYWSRLAIDGAQLEIRPRHTTIAFPTHDGLTLALVSRKISEFPRVRLDHEAEYTATLPQQIRAGQKETRVVGTADLPNFYRKAYGL